MHKTGIGKIKSIIQGVLFLTVPLFCLGQSNTKLQSDTILAAQLLQKAIEKFNLAEYDSCIIYSRSSMKESLEINAWEKWYKGFEKIAYSNMYKGEFEKIVEESEKYIEEITVQNGDSLQLARLYGWIGYSTFYLEEFDKGMEANLEGIRILEAIDKPEEGTGFYMNVGIEYTKRSDYVKALSYLERAENYSLAQNKTQSLPIIWTNMAYAFDAMLEFEKCIEVGHKIIELDGLNFSTAMIMSESYRELEDYEKSRSYLESSKQFIEDESENSFNYHFHKALLDLETGGPNAERNFNIAIKEAKDSDFISAREMAETQIKLGEYFEIAGKYDLAELNFSEALNNLDSTFTLRKLEQQNIYNESSLGNSVWIMEALFGLAKSEIGLMESDFSTESLDKALAYFMNCFFVIENMRLNFQSEGAKLYMSEYVNQIYESGLNFIFDYKDKFQNHRIEDEILYILEKSRSFVLSSSLQEVRAKSMSGIPDSLLKIEKSMLKSISKIQKNGVDNLDADSKDRLFMEQRELEKLNKYFKESFPLYAKIKFQTKVPSIETVRSELLGRNQAIIYYLWGQEHLFTFVLSQDNLLFERLELDEISETLLQYQNLLNSRSFDSQPQTYFSQFNELSYSLFSSLLANNIKILGNYIDDLIILPDGNLHLLSFESLIKKKSEGEVSYSLVNMEYLIEDFAFSYANSIDLLVKQKTTRENKYTNVFSGFAPSFDKASEDGSYRSCGNGKMGDLKYNKEEVQSILSITGGNSYFSANASKSAFIEEAKKSKVIHLATHACAHSTDINQNRIFFSNDEFLSIIDIYQMDIRADMIVLSACETGLGKLATGEGVMSLARAFTFAGVPSTIMSLWSIPDQSTSTIMSKYYAYLAKGEDKSKALQMAKLDFIREASLLHQHPHFWSSTVVIGDTKNISFGNSYLNFIYLLGLLMLGGIIFFIAFQVKKSQN